MDPRTTRTPSPEAVRAAREEGWDRTEWAGPTSSDPTTARDADRWNKTQWIGDQGEGAPEPVDPDLMPEGASSISGRRQTSGEQHWARPARDLPPPDTHR